MLPLWTWKQPLVSQGFQLGPSLILKPTEIHQDTSWCDLDTLNVSARAQVDRRGDEDRGRVRRAPS